MLYSGTDAESYITEYTLVYEKIRALGSVAPLCATAGDLAGPHTMSSRKQVENNYFTEMCSGSEEGSYSRLIDVCVTQL